MSLAKEHHGLDGNKSGVWECQTEKLHGLIPASYLYDICLSIFSAPFPFLPCTSSGAAVVSPSGASTDAQLQNSAKFYKTQRLVTKLFLTTILYKRILSDHLCNGKVDDTH